MSQSITTITNNLRSTLIEKYNLNNSYTTAELIKSAMNKNAHIKNVLLQINYLLHEDDIDDNSEELLSILIAQL